MNIKLFVAIIAAVAAHLPAASHADVWGSFDSTRINYAAGTITGTNHSQLRTIVTAAGDTIGTETPTLTSGYLSTIDVFYTSLLTNGGSVLSADEQTALKDWIAAGGVLIVTGDIWDFPTLETFTSFYGVTGWASASGTPTVDAAGHPTMTGVTTIEAGSMATFTHGADATLLVTTDSGPYAVAMDQASGFASLGCIYVMGDHNIWTDGMIGSANHAQWLTNVVAWTKACQACGNGLDDAGEQCDDGNRVDGDGCSATCELEYCGNGVVEPDEVCDDGNNTDGDGCAADCFSNETCGNGVVDLAADEVCDDGNTADDDGCSADCLSDETCGNGTVDTGEVCDDGNNSNGDDCSADCLSDETCGNGIVDGGEQCDDGNTTDGDGCDAACELEIEYCGNGTVEDGELCDDGNNAGGDGCSADCQSTEACGNDIVDYAAGEECDDGNTTDGDGCDAMCLEEIEDVGGEDDDGGCGCRLGASHEAGGGFLALLALCAFAIIGRRPRARRR